MVIARLIPDEDKTDYTPNLKASITSVEEVAPQTKVITFKFIGKVTAEIRGNQTIWKIPGRFYPDI